MSKLPSKSQNNKNIKKRNSSLSEKEEEILEYIGRLYETNLETTIKRLDLANFLNCSPAMVNKLLKKLKDKELIVHKKYGEIKLTKNGFNTANALIRRHRLSEALFVNLLGLDASDAHEFACKFEHILDEKLANRIEEVLNHPEFCPHGHLIKPTSRTAEIEQSLPLTEFTNNDFVKISQIVNEESTFLKKLAQGGIEVGVIIRILEKSPIDKTLLIEVDGKNIPLGEETAKNLLGIPLRIGGGIK